MSRPIVSFYLLTLPLKLDIPATPMINPFSKPHPSSVLAKSVKTQVCTTLLLPLSSYSNFIQKDAERCRLSMDEPRPSLSKRYESFERAKSQFSARLKTTFGSLYLETVYMSLGLGE